MDVDEKKALARGKLEIKKEELQKISQDLCLLAEEISDILRRASDSPTAAYIDSKRELIGDVLNPAAPPLETHLDQLPSKVQSFIEKVKKYQEVNKEAVSLSRQAR